MTVDALSSVCNLGVLDSLTEGSVDEIVSSWSGFCSVTEALLVCNNNGELPAEFESQVHTLCEYGLQSLVEQHFLRSLQV